MTRQTIGLVSSAVYLYTDDFLAASGYAFNNFLINRLLFTLIKPIGFQEGRTTGCQTFSRVQVMQKHIFPSPLPGNCCFQRPNFIGQGTRSALP